MPRNECKGPRLQPYGQYENPSILRMFTRLLGALGSPTYRPCGHLPYFEKLEVGHTTVCIDKEDNAASWFFAAIMDEAADDPPHS